MPRTLAASTPAGRNLVRRQLVLLAGYLLAVAAFASAGLGVTYGMLSATGLESRNAVASGSVTLSSAATGTCGASGLLPDGSTSSCGLKVTYGGSAPAYLGLDILVVSRAGVGGSSLYDPSTSGALSLSVTSSTPTVSYQLPATASACPATVTAPATCYRVDGAVVSAVPFTATSAPVTFTTSFGLPTSSPTTFQGGSAQIVLTAHAAQAGNVSAKGCVAGRPCATMSWN